MTGNILRRSHLHRRGTASAGDDGEGRTARRGLCHRQRPVSLRTHLQWRELESGSVGASDRTGREVKDGEYLLAVTAATSATREIYSYFLGTAGVQTSIRSARRRMERARGRDVVSHSGRAGPAQPGLDRGQPRKVDQLSGGRVCLRLASRHRQRRLPRASTAGSSRRPAKEGAVIDERFNHGGLCRITSSKCCAARRWRASWDARERTTPSDRRDLRPEGDDHQPVRRLGRRRAAVVLPAHGTGQARRHQDVGRTRRNRRLPAAHGWRLRHRPSLGDLRPRRKVGSREHRHRPGHRGRTGSNARAPGPRSTARAGRGGRSGTVEGRSAQTVPPAGVSVFRHPACELAVENRVGSRSRRSAGRRVKTGRAVSTADRRLPTAD